MVALDENGEVIRPAKLWCDTETVRQAEALTARLGGPQNVIDIIGNPVAAGFTASKILWLKENEPGNYGRLRTVLLPHDYINYWLTGEKRAECGDASGTAYFDVRRRTWSESVLNAIDESGRLVQALPQLIESREPAGTLRSALAAEFGFRDRVIVASGGGDNMMAAIGTGNVAAGVVTASLGTSGTIYSFSKKPVVDDRGELAAFCSSDGNWLPLRLHHECHCLHRTDSRPDGTGRPRPQRARRSCADRRPGPDAAPLLQWRENAFAPGSQSNALRFEFDEHDRGQPVPRVDGGPNARPSLRPRCPQEDGMRMAVGGPPSWAEAPEAGHGAGSAGRRFRVSRGLHRQREKRVHSVPRSRRCGVSTASTVSHDR